VINLSKLLNTYSIIAFDPENRQIGGAMQTHNFGACQSVIWGRHGVGIVASQARSDRFYAFAGLEMMSLGKTAEEVLNNLVSDSNIESNQVAMIDVKGNTAAYTGKKCTPEAGHRVGKNYSCQANMMLKDTVWAAMAEAFENSEGELVDRMMDALEAAENEGGDIRGAQSAVIKIFSPEKVERPWTDCVYDFRVYDSPEPLQELRRLIRVKKAHQQTIAAMNLLNKEAVDDETIALSMQRFDAALSRIPNMDSRLQHQCQYAVSLFCQGKENEALLLLRKVFAADSRWREMVVRIARVYPEEPYTRMLAKV